LLGSCSLGSGLRSRRLALRKDNAWWGSSVSTACAKPYRKALPRTTIEGCKTERGPFSLELWLGSERENRRVLSHNCPYGKRFEGFTAYSYCKSSLVGPYRRGVFRGKRERPEMASSPTSPPGYHCGQGQLPQRQARRRIAGLKNLAAGQWLYLGLATLFLKRSRRCADSDPAARVGSGWVLVA